MHRGRGREDFLSRFRKHSLFFFFLSFFLSFFSILKRIEEEEEEETLFKFPSDIYSLPPSAVFGTTPR
jgi:hypothetical protein